MIRIVIADDHALIREGFKRLIEKETDMSVVGEAEDAGQVLELLRRIECDILVLDISMPGRSGLSILKDLENAYPGMKILILSIHPEDRFAIRALQSSASGYITKESAPEELIMAIRKVHDGGKYVSPELAEKLVINIGKKEGQPPHESLSNREFEVLRLIGRGKTVSQISRELNLSQSTVNTYRKRILEKMNVNTNAELIHYTIKNNLVE